jgi:anti-sigma28 factor (negative regulator of flagellin synthesis)
MQFQIIGQRTQSDASLRSALDEAQPQERLARQCSCRNACAFSQRQSAGSDELHLSNVAARAMAEPDFDRVKVESIKKAIQEKASTL